MSWQTQIIQQLTNIQNWITDVNTNKKEVNQFPEVTSAGENDEIPIDGGAGIKKIKVKNLITTVLGGYIWVEGETCYVDKATGNVDNSIIQELDVVYEKDVNHAGATVTLRGWRYDTGAGDKLERTSYTKVKSYI